MPAVRKQYSTLIGCVYAITILGPWYSRYQIGVVAHIWHRSFGSIKSLPPFYTNVCITCHVRIIILEYATCIVNHMEGVHTC